MTADQGEAPARPRARDLGLPLRGEPGAWNAITDVPGVSVGYSTLIAEDPCVRTGVTAVLPRPAGDLLHPVWAGTFALNGNGEMTGCHWIAEGGWFTGPIAITNTFSLGIAHHGVMRWLCRRFPDVVGVSHWPLPVVAETFDGWLNDIAGLHVTEADVIAAIESAAGGLIAEGCVGGGTGMIAYEFKAGTGTASRRVAMAAGDYHLGVLVQANHGLRDWLTVCGAPVGARMGENRLWSSERGSIIAVVATDAPLLPHQLQRLARRAGLGVGRGGTPASNGSGDIFIAFTTANDPGAFPEPPMMRFEALSNDEMNPLFLATVEAVEEAVLNALLAARTMTGLHGRTVHAIDPDRLAAMMRGTG
jgi:L-aminopeptidase/D-esterase-like protein